MDRLTGVKITKAESKKTGKGKYGDWELFHIEIDDGDWKDQHFSYFADKNHPAVKAGQEVDFIEFETEEKDGYTNYTIKKIGLKEDKPKPQPKGKSGGTGGSGPPRNEKAMFYAYGKDLVVAQMAKLDHFQQLTNEQIVARVAYMAETLYKASQGDDKTLARLREVYSSGRHTPPEEGSSNTEQPREPEKDNTPDEFDPERWVAEEAFHCTSITNLPHLENWWKKICPSEERKKAEEAGHWQGLCDAYQERKTQLKAEFQAQKELEEAGMADEEPF